MAYEKVLITGGSGRLGRYVVDELAKVCTVTVMDLVAPQQTGVAHLSGNVTDLAAVRAAVAGHDAVVHLAAIDLGVPAEPEGYFGVNVMGTWNALQAACEAGIGKVVIASSVAASGLTEMRPEFPPDCLPVDESHRRGPVHAYGVSKLVVEDVAEAFSRRGDVTVVCLRPTVIAFPWHVPKMLERLRSGFRWMGAYVSPEDTASAFRLALDFDAHPFDVFYINADDGCTEVPTLERARALYGTLPALRDPAWFERNPTASLFDARKALRELGWQPTSSWPELVRLHGGD